MSNEVKAMTFKELQDIVAQLSENPDVSEDTKIFLDTGWDSLQEILPGTIHPAKVQHFEVEDVLTKELFGGFALLEKAEKVQAEGPQETVIVIENQY